LISAIIPARNEEASIQRVVHSLAEQPEIAEIIVVDDQSTDETPSILAILAARIPKLKLIRAPELPRGWTGKNHAVWLGANAADVHADWLLFTDADTHHLPGSAARALADASFHSSDLISYSPGQELRTFWERALIPIVYWRLSQRFPFDRVNDAGSADAAANGQFILVRREAYLAIGGHAAVASQVVEDVALARRAKQAGFRLFFAPGQGIVETRMYRSFSAMWEGWTKNLYPLFGANVGEMLFEIDSSTPALSLLFSVALVLRFAIGGQIDWLVAVVAAILFARPWVGYGVWLRRNRYPGEYIKYCLFGAPLYAAALIASWWKNMRGSVAWKGRKYAQHA
jgi:glycosyltransferase involved in cell wall biosynthesis